MNISTQLPQHTHGYGYLAKIKKSTSSFFSTVKSVTAILLIIPSLMSQGFKNETFLDDWER